MQQNIDKYPEHWNILPIQPNQKIIKILWKNGHINYQEKNHLSE